MSSFALGAIEPAAYHDPAVLKREEQRLFRGTWQLAGFTWEAAPTLVRSIGGRSVVVTGEGELRAFANVCPTCGRRLVLEKEPLQRCHASPRPWQLATLGPLVFVRETAGPSLEEHLGGVLELVRLYARSLGRQILEDARVVRANWKLPVENSMDQYHLHHVHPRTLARAGFAGNDYRLEPPHSVFRAPINAAMNARWNAVVGAAFPERPYVNAGYEHVAVFPNLLFSSTQGTIFSVQVAHPLGPRECRFVNQVFLTRSAPVEGKTALVAAFQEQVIQLGQAVLCEDLAVCEQTQLGLEECRVRAKLVDEEARIGCFQRAYAEAMR